MVIPNLIGCLSQLIAAPSVSSVSPAWDQTNAQVIALLAEWLSALGFKVETLPISGWSGKFNLIARYGQGAAGLVLAGHTDTVPWDTEHWVSDPFILNERSGRLYGLGICDMKGFFALVLEALRDLHLQRLRQPLVIIATADEESSMCGAQALMTMGTALGRQVLIGEPTGLQPVRMHKGVAMEAVRVIGRAGHSSDPRLGNSALEGMYLVLGEILRWREHLQSKHHNPMFQVPVPTLNLGHIHGGDNPNRICAQCELHIDIRPLPGMDLDMLRGDLEYRLRGVLADSGLTVEVAPLFEGIPASETPADAPLIQAAERLTGQTAGAVAFGTEAPYFNRLGLQTLIIGPGNIAQAHQPNEYLALAHIPPYVRLIRDLIGEFCF